MAPTIERPGVALWAAWSAINVVALLVAVGLSWAAVWVVATVLLRDEFRMPQLLVAALAIVGLGTAITTFALSLAQYRVLERVFWLMKRSEWLAATVVCMGMLWLLGGVILTIRVLLDNTVLGDRLALPDLTRVPIAWLGLALGVIVGAIIGSAQRSVLKRYMAGTHWWVPAHIIGWSLGLMIASQARDALVAGKPLAETAPAVAGWLALGAAIVATVNGFVLVWLARRRAEAGAYQ
jgi:hypothetical protein